MKTSDVVLFLFIFFVVLVVMVAGCTSQQQVTPQQQVEKKMTTPVGYELFLDRQNVKNESNWTSKQAILDIASSMKMHPNQAVEGLYNGKAINISMIGYELFWDGKKVGHELTWNEEQAIFNFRWNTENHTDLEVVGLFNGEPLYYLKSVTVLPVFFVPVGEKEPTAYEIQLLQTHLLIAQKRYKEMMKERDTFTISSEPPIIYKSPHKLIYFRQSADEQAGPEWTNELLQHFNMNRFNLPYILVIIVMNPYDNYPRGGGRPLNGGLNTGGGNVIMSSYNLNKVDGNFQSTLQHELGHSFGLLHVDEGYGYDQYKSDSIMSHTPTHQWKGFNPPDVQGTLIPEDLRALSINKLIFPKFYFDPNKDIPHGYDIKKIGGLVPMNLSISRSERSISSYLVMNEGVCEFLETEKPSKNVCYVYYAWAIGGVAFAPPESDLATLLDYPQPTAIDDRSKKTSACPAWTLYQSSTNLRDGGEGTFCIRKNNDAERTEWAYGEQLKVSPEDLAKTNYEVRGRVRLNGAGENPIERHFVVKCPPTSCQ